MEKFENYLVRRIDADKRYEELLRFPRYFEIETVNACNARCPMCTIEEWTRHSPIMKDELFQKIVAELVAHRDTVKRVSLYRDGEPLLDKKLAPRIAMLKQGGIREVAISTNVSLLDETRARDLLEAGLDTIILSIDSLDKAVFESIRVRLVHEVVMENALRFIRLRDEMKARTRIWVRMIRQESNYDEWPAFEQFWRGHLGENDRVNYSNLHNWGSQLRSFKPVAETYEPGLPCVALWSLMIIFANGDVPLCNVDYANKYPTGNLSTSSIADMWQSEAMTGRRALHMSGHKSDIDICTDCNVWDEPPDIHNVAAEYGAKVSLG
ncbi:MAG: radical SAM protein [Magnetococcales bacterium]|nr:radical SAM protein [Magnetococcales bacterium]